jgi:hypothetical protein
MKWLQETGELTEELIKQHSVVVLTNTSLEEQKRINKITHDSSNACDFNYLF